MHLIPSKTVDASLVGNKYAFLDTDFLGLLFQDGDAFSDTLSIFKNGYLVVDSWTRFEFLRDVFLPKQRSIKEKFLNTEIFTLVEENVATFKRIRDNALVLSYLYAHNSHKCASIVDLLLAGRALFHAPKSLVITGNGKDFSPALFDTLGVLNHEEKDGSIRAYSILSFSKNKYEKAMGKWNLLSN